jgi:putative colanic acid biosynthesis acetyltransferase WcaF
MQPRTRSQITTRLRLARLAWNLVCALLYRPTPRFLHPWRRLLLRLFGAEIGRGAHPYPRARIWAPWNLSMGPRSCLADGVDCYSVARITLGAGAIVSQDAFLCTATHNIDDPAFPLEIAPIALGPDAWVAAGAFIGPGVSLGTGAVALARAVVIKDVAAWDVVGGNPARRLRWRTEHTVTP